jgi:SsrA-binding protein
MARQERPVAENRRARHDYDIVETVEAGIALTGTEVKSLRAGHVNLRDSHAVIQHGECLLLNCHIAPYAQGNRWNHEPTRTRKLLLHRREILGLWQAVRRQGYTLVPLRVYLNEKGRAKILLGLARGRRQYDKRAQEAARDAARRMQRAVRTGGRNSGAN